MKNLRSQWKCGNCGKIYSVDELISLKRIKLVESDTEPEKQHGFTSVCECGYRFYIDRWKIRDNIKIKVDDNELNLLISTIFLELNHKMQLLDGKDEYYETGILELELKNKDEFDNNKYEIKKLIFMKRYETKDVAIKGHNRILGLIKEGKYKIEKIGEDNSEDNMVIFGEENDNE